MSQVHPQARTTPRTRAEIKVASETLEVLAQQYNVSKATARKWKNREDVQDRSHRPHKLSTTLKPGQEAVVVELRRMLLLPLYDLLLVTREFINAAVSRSGLDRCLRRHGVSQLRALQVLPEGEEPRPRPSRTANLASSMSTSSTCRRCPMKGSDAIFLSPLIGPHDGSSFTSMPIRAKSAAATSCHACTRLHP